MDPANGLPSLSRRAILKSGMFAATTFTVGSTLAATHRVELKEPTVAVDSQLPIHVTINKVAYALQVEPALTLLDLLREKLHLTGTKKGCNRGECGACTVLLNGRRVNACLVFAATIEGKQVQTIEGLSEGGQLHPVQQAFIDHDAFQCGFCTSGQIMSAVACIEEGHTRTNGEIREWMSGNICRCSAYPQISAAVASAAAKLNGGGDGTL
ncbi:(2Fe-2S)-binding protein [Pseudomonas sp. HN11]|uniref:(2Fe-2S)-binding protein n=1 Tax=Pseudomonas sp. HN11 TaxID=1344094 RepID=UPI001F444862|nr:(2Fe-2S)-binding protein [Pseudomonas sp. HN11]UII74377.1 (2Fe-2S)-binding protein [Pseudomonas sp. HN11]